MTNRRYAILGGAAIVTATVLCVVLGPRGQGTRAQAESAEPETQGANVVRLAPEAARLADLKTATVRRGASTSDLLLSGTCQVDQDRVARVTASVSGRIAQLSIGPGRPIAAGDVVAVIGSVELADARKNLTDAVSARYLAEAQMTVAAAKVAAARTKLDRQREFQHSGAFAQKPVEDAKAAVSSAEADLRAAESEHERAQSELTRSQELYKSEIMARKDLELAQAEAKSARARLDAAVEKARLARQGLAREEDVSRRNLLNRREVEDAEAELRAANADLAAARVARGNAARAEAAARSVVAALGAPPSGESAALAIRAPIGGVVLDRPVTLGQSVERGAEICEIADTSRVWVIGNAYEKDLPRLRVGQQVTLTVAAYPGTTFAGRVSNLDTMLDEKSRTIRVRCEIANPNGRLRPGMFAELRVVAGAKAAAVLVPEAAIQEDAGARYVFVAASGSYRRVDVQLGEASNGYHEVISGLKDGDRVVTEGSFILKSESKKSEMEGD